jgi:hypothetical protein
MGGKGYAYSLEVCAGAVVVAETLCDGGEERARSFCSRSIDAADAATGGGGSGWDARGVGGGPSDKREATFMG